MFNDMELIGVPYTLVIGERNLDENKVELKKPPYWRKVNA